MASRQIGLNFHGIGEPTPDRDVGEIPFWISHRKYTEILDRIAALPDPQNIRISFDDGNLSDLETGLPLLLERGLRAEFFVLTGRIGMPGSLGASGIRALQAVEMGIGSHGIHHRNWASLGLPDLQEELIGSRKYLEDLCGAPVHSASVPFGSYNRRVFKALLSAGYSRIYTSDGGTTSWGDVLCPRHSIRQSMELPEIEDILAGRFTRRDRIRCHLRMLRKRFV